MAFVNVPKDLNTVKTKVALNLTKRQLICFGAAAAIGIPLYIFTRGALGNSAAALLMIGAMLPQIFYSLRTLIGIASSFPVEVKVNDYIFVKRFFVMPTTPVTPLLFFIQQMGLWKIL